MSVIVVALLSPLIAGAGIWYSNSQISEQLQLDRQGQITDRYNKAVENLGDDAMDVRLGGIYALQRIMEDSPRDQPTVANVLATYIRTHTAKPPKKSEEVAADVHAALTVLAYRDPTHDGTFTFDLRHAHLPNIELLTLIDDPHGHLTPADLGNADLTPADLRNADLTPADLTGANLTDANLHNADLNGAEMAGTYLTEADLADASLTGVHLNDADLNGTDLHNTDLTGAYLTDANLHNAHLADAYLTDAFLTDAQLQFADLTGAHLTGAVLHNADLTDADLADADLTGAHLTGAVLHNADLTEADLTDADLTGVAGLEVQQVLSARLDRSTKLPEHIARDPAIKARIAEKHE